MPNGSRIVYTGRPKSRRSFSPIPFYIFISLVMASALGAGAWYLLNLPALRIGNISVEGTKRISAEGIKETVRLILNQRKWPFLPADNFFIVSSQGLEYFLSQNFPGIESIDVKKQFPSTLRVLVKERELWGIYCLKEIAVGPCFYVDGQGIAYETLDAVSGALLPLIYSSKPAMVGEVALPRPILEFYEGAARAMDGISLKLVSLELATSTSDVRLNIDEGWYALVPLQDISHQWLTVLDTVLEREISQRRDELEYVDLRFGNKVFYKYRQ